MFIITPKDAVNNIILSSKCLGGWINLIIALYNKYNVKIQINKQLNSPPIISVL